MITILINEQYTEVIQGELLEQAAQAVLNQHELESEHDLTIAVEDDARLQELNREFLEIDAPTDVLSFPSGGDETDMDTGHPYLGDIIISYPRALEQSAAAGHALANEMQLLVVHGTLHLLGYDHAEEEEKAEMWSVQAEILQGLGVKLNRLPE